jgi:hypothetical protein
MISISRTAIAGYVGLVFLSGAAVGGFGHRLFYTATSVSAKGAVLSPEEMRKKYVETLHTRLQLTDDQLMKLNLILDESRGRYHENQEKMKPALEAIRNDQTEHIRAILNPQQRAEYEQYRKEREEARKKAGPHPGPGF